MYAGTYSVEELVLVMLPSAKCFYITCKIVVEFYNKLFDWTEFLCERIKLLVLSWWKNTKEVAFFVKQVYQTASCYT